ncbi:MAG: sugar transferase [Bacteroidetes bacterium]|nr:sugar transferase [Bacteroidota bacterium]
MYKNYLKRIFDFLAAFFGLLLLSPIFLLVMVGLYFANQGKPFFFQARPGLNEKMFKIIKFKTMNDKKDKGRNFLPEITGWAQVNGRNAISWQKKFELDVWYVDLLSFKTD